MKKTERILAAVVVLLMLCIAAPLCMAAAQETGGTCGDNLTWTLQDDVLTISGTGAMADYSRDQAPWRTQTVKRVLVEEGVTSISENAFQVNFDLEEAVLPASLQTIGKGAFWQCVSLKTADIPETVTETSAVTELSAVAVTVMVQDPSAFAVTVPFPSTVAMDVSEEAKETRGGELPDGPGDGGAFPAAAEGRQGQFHYGT